MQDVGNYNNEPPREALWMSLVLMSLCVMVMMCSCKSQERVVTVYSHSTDTLVQTKVERDSIYAHDSIYVRERGDTVWIERWHTRWRERLLADTVYVAKCDTLTRMETITEYREKELTWWQKTKMGAGVLLMVLLAIAAIILVGRWHLKKLM